MSEACLAPLTFASHAYHDFHLVMPLYICRRWDGEVIAREGQKLAWVRANRLRDYLEMFREDPRQKQLSQEKAELEKFLKTVDQILQKSGATIDQKEKWDERKLAYEIGGHKRATYYLTYFSAPTDAPAKISADETLNSSVRSRIGFL